MVQQIMSRSSRVPHLRHENFEYLIILPPISLRYRNVEVIGQSGDGGVDVVTEKRGQGLNEGKVERVVVQCKRWADKSVDVGTLRSFLETVSRKGAKEGVLITTSGFTVDAGEIATVNAHLELIDGLGLHEWLDRAFGTGVYRITSRD